MTAHIHQFVSTYEKGDAIGNQIGEISNILHEWGYESEIFAKYWHPELKNACRSIDAYKRLHKPNDILIWHYAGSAILNKFMEQYAPKITLYYHNITPARFFRHVNPDVARDLEQGRRDLLLWSGRVPAIAASPYNKTELEAAGFEVIGTARYLVIFDKLDAGRNSPGAEKIRTQYADPTSKDWLYVGRLVPNKCLEDVIKAFYYYHSYINPQSRLFLVGNGFNMALYIDDLQSLVDQLGLREAVLFTGAYSAEEGLAAFFELADLYISMSEHEGFCVPLIEAMHFDLPVLAHAATGVPYTMGHAGVQTRHKDYPLIAECIHEVFTNSELHQHLIAGQQTRQQELSPDNLRTELRESIEAMVNFVRN